jgi:hypothetical protein
MSLFFTPRTQEAFSDTLLLVVPAAPATTDPLEQLLAAERADWAMLRLVLCSAVATLVMGVAGSLVA